jgi:hypothetical protein
MCRREGFFGRDLSSCKLCVDDLRCGGAPELELDELGMDLSVLSVAEDAIWFSLRGAPMLCETGP